MDVNIYTSPTCGYCAQTKRFLNERGVKFTEYDVTRDRSAAEEMVRRTGQRAVPVIIVDGEVIVGFNRPRLEQLFPERGAAARGRFGLRVADATTVAPKYGAPAVSGAFVGAVAPSSFGERAGIRVGDIITAVNQWRITNAADLENALANLRPGSQVTISLLRGQETLKASVVL